MAYVSPPEFKIVKQRLSAEQNLIRMALEDGNLPPRRQVADFLATSREMAQMGAPPWQAAMETYLDQLDTFVESVESGNPERAREQLDALLRLKISCHQAFR